MADRCFRAVAACLVAALFAGMAFAQSTLPSRNPVGGHQAPYLNLKSARSIATRYLNARPGSLRALSTATADFDEDGMPDLATGFVSSNGTGSVTIHRGNVDALWPYGHDTDPSPFHPDVRTFALSEAPDFLAAGDFDADGHWDLVAGHTRSTRLFFLRGDGHGGFAEPVPLEVPGAITAMTSGEINRADGLTDLMVALTGATGPKALVFESPLGALRAAPESFDLPAEATDLAVMPMDGGTMNGLAVAAGRHLVLIHGRDRRLTHSKAIRENVTAASISRQTLPFAIRSLAVGSFSSSTRDLAALGDDGQVHILERSEAAQLAGMESREFSLFGMTSAAFPALHSSAAASTSEATSVQRTQLKTTTMILRRSIGLPLLAAGASRLVSAHVAATGHDSLVVIDPGSRKLHLVTHANRGINAAMSVSASLDIAGDPTAVQPMRLNKDPLSGLVVLTTSQSEPVVYATAPAFTCTVTNTSDDANFSLRLCLEGAAIVAGGIEIDFNIPSSDKNRDPATGVFTIQPVGQNDLLALPNLVDATTVDAYTQPGASPNSLATGDNARLLIEINGSMSGAGPSGFQTFTNAGATIRGFVLSNFVEAPIPDGTGRTHGGAGIDLESSGNFVEGNFMGMDAGGTFAKSTYLGVISFGGETGNVIGGTTAQARNLIGGCRFVGIGLQQAAIVNSYLVQGNYIGTDKTGTQPIPNLAGVGLEGFNAVLGGTTAGSRNLVSGNSLVNVAVARGCSTCLAAIGNLVQGNYIGTDITGTQRLQGGPNDGVSLAQTQGDTIGGTTPAARNIISGSSSYAVDLFGGNENAIVEGNYIGLDVTGTVAVPQGLGGVKFGTDYYDTAGNHYSGGPAVNNLIGGEVSGAANVISGNQGAGVIVTSLAGFTQGNVIAGNLIGTNAAGTGAIPNQGDGVTMTAAALGNTLGGTDPAAANVIANNTGNGVTIDPGATGGSNSVLGNAIFNNGGVGVRIPTSTGNKVSRNQIYNNGGLGLDIDAAGVLSNSACNANTSGANLLQNAPVLTSGSGTTFVTATATDPNGNTSEFSNCVPATLSGSTLNIAGSFTAKANTTYTIEYFSNTACDASGFGEGKQFLGAQTITTPGSCTATLSDPVDLTKADLSVTNVPTSNLTASIVYEAFPFTSTITNNGPATAANVVWTDQMQANTLYISSSTTQGACGFASGTVTCNIGSLPPGATATVSANFAPTDLTSFTNTVSVTSSTPDPNSANNSASVTRSIVYDPFFHHLAPASVNTDSPDTVVNLVGLGFYPGSSVTYNGNPIASTFNPNWNPNDCGGGANGICTALSITVPASLLTAPATVPVNVVTTGISAGSQTRSFSVVSPPVVPGPVTHFGLSLVNPYPAGTTQALSITALDASNLTVPGYLGTVNLTTTDPSPLVFANGGTPTVTFTTGDGGIALGVVTLQTQGPQSITVTDSLNSAITSTVNTVVSHGSAGTITVGGTPQATQPNQPFAQPLTVTVTDIAGNPVPNQQVTFTTPGSGPSATLSSTTATTNNQGVASVTASANGTSGSYLVTVTFGAEVPGGKNIGTYLLTNGSGTPTLTATQGTPQTTFIGQLFQTPLKARLVDSQGNPVQGARIYFDSGNVGGASAIVTAEANTDATGTGSSTANAPANATPGTFPVIASIGGLTATYTLTELSPQPVVVTIASGSPQSTAVGSAFLQPLKVHVTDGFGTARSGVVVTYIPPASGASATLSAGTTSTDGSGNASLTATANNTTGTYNVSASVNGQTVNFALTNATAGSGPPASIAPVAGTPQSQFVNQQFGASLQVLVKDGGGTPLAGTSVTFTAPSTGASGTFVASATVTTNGAGIAAAPAFTANTVSGAYTVTATAGAVSTTFALTNLGGAPVTMQKYAGDNQSTAINTAYATPLAVRLFDQYGNPTSANWAGTFFIAIAGPSGANATFTGSTSVVTDANGVATAPTLTANGTAGAMFVLAFFNSANVTFNLTNITASPAAVIAAGGTPQSATVNTAFGAALSAKVTDNTNTPLAGITVNFSAPSSGASAGLSAPSAITNASGIASVTATANGALGTYSVTASVGALNASFSLTNTPAPPGGIAGTGGTPQATTVGTAFATNLSVKVTDAGNNPLTGVTVNFSAPSSGASATFSGTTITNASGIASVTATANQVAGAYTVTASAGGFSTSFSLTNVPGVVTTVIASAGTPQSTIVNTPFATALQATAKDAFGNAVPGAQINFTAPGSGASGTFSASAAVSANASGIAIAPSLTANTIAGSYQVTASSGPASANFNLTNLAGNPAAITATAGTPQSAVVNTAFTTALRANVQDAFGNPINGASVTFAAPVAGASGTFGGSATVATNAAGLATAPAFTANSIAGGYSVTATTPGVVGPATFSLTNTSGAAGSIVPAGTPQTATVNTAFATALKVTITDAGNNPVQGVTVTFTAPASGASGAFGGSATVVTNASGVAAAPTFTANTVAGSYAVTASTGTLSTNFNLTNLPGPAASVIATAGTPQSAAINTTFATALQAAVRDSFGNPVSGVTVSFAGPNSGVGGSFAPGATPTTNASGVATATSFTANGAIGSYSVTATATGVVTPASFSLTNTAGPPATLTPSGTPQSTTVNTAFATPLSVTVKDASNNPVAGASVTFSLPASGASGTFGGTATATANASGVATAPTLTANTAAGSYTVTATAGSATASFALTNNPGAAASVVATAGTPQSATVNTTFATGLQATVKDAFGNPVPGVSVTFAVPNTGAGAAFGSGATQISNAAGIVTAPTLTANGTAGSYAATAAATGVAALSSFALTNLAGPPTSMIATGTPQSTTVNTAFASALQVTVKDAGGNPVAGAAVTFTAPSSGASGTFAASATVTANSSGVATAPAFTANTIVGSYTVTATSGSASAAFSLTNTPGGPGQLIQISGSPQSIVISTAFATALALKVTDNFGNVLSGVSVTFSAPVNGASGTFAASATVQTNSSGVATAPAFTADTVAGSYAVSAATGSLNTAFALTNLPGAPAIITPTGTPQSTPVHQPFPALLSVKITDASNNPISGLSVTFAVTPATAGGTFTGAVSSTTVTTGATGAATAPTFTANDNIGAYTVTATSGSLLATFNLTNTVSPAAAIQVFSGNNQSTVLGGAFSLPLVARVVDGQGNPSTNIPVTFTLPANGPSAAFQGSSTPLSFSASTNAQGLVSTPLLTANRNLGDFTITASTGSLQATFTLHLTTLPAISVSPATMLFRYDTGLTPPAAQTATVFNSTGAISAAPDQPWLKARVIPNGALEPSISVSVDPAGLAPGNYYGNVAITRDVLIQVTLTVIPKPQVNSSTKSLTFQYTQEQPAPPEQTVSLVAFSRNFSFSLGTDGAWLKATAESASTPTLLHVNVAPAGLDAGTYQGTIHVIAPDATNSPYDIAVTLVVIAAAPTPKPPTITGMVNAASFQGTAASGNEILSLFGTNLTCSNSPQVRVDGVPAIVLGGTPTQLNWVAPNLTGRTSIQVQFACGGTVSAPFSLDVATVVPGIFMSAGTAQVAAYNQGFTLNGPAIPIPSGGVVMLFGTGFGPLAPPDANGLQSLTLPVTVSVGGAAAEVAFAGAAPGLPGVTQINVRIPPGLSGAAVPLTVASNGVPVPTTLTVAVGPPVIAAARP
jgi:adhesin/invasin